MIENGSAFGLIVRERREALGMSQRALARAAGVTPAYVSLIEHGRRQPVREVVERLAQTLAAGEHERNAILRAAGYAPASGGELSKRASSVMVRLDGVLSDPGLTPAQRATVETLVLVYASGLAARAKEGRPLVADIAAPWQARVLEALQEKMAEDFEHFRDAYLNRLFDT